ncbi:PAS domain S-box protein [Sphaerospermopsis aphanizomenoides BCCUSP55]|uniref:hybrid sensor histidine kinase/response regulator n=1 Tax=Sphaerospermopsis aphanizomenoides TaxID=459663 RepID=UPI001908FC40|nr:PAS domain S-box protein [Sphaerospermopsis aphanizomenoides]MBK1987071.1 PAS domain S-box protein [Sphaerospermopsis aphanizomenoides BCCUSP55]
MIFSVSNYEAARLDTLYQYEILDTEPEQTFDDLVSLAALLCNTPIAVINLIDAHRQWFKAKVGLDHQEMALDEGFCRVCLENKDVLIIPDTLADEQFATSNIVTSEPYIRFYAGVPLVGSGEYIIGTLCIADQVPRQITPQQLAGLQSISRLIVRQLEIRRNLKELARINLDYKQAQEALVHSESTLHSFFESAPMMMGIVELVDNDILHIADNPNSAKFFGLTPQAMQNRLAREMGVDITHLNQWIKYYRQAELAQAPVRFEYVHKISNQQVWLSATVSPIAKNHHNRQQFAYIVEDITNRKQVEQKLREQAALIDIVTDAIVVRDLENNIFLWNKSAEKLYGWKVEEVINKNASQIWFGEPVSQQQEIYQTVLKYGSWQGELNKNTKFGTEIIVESCWNLVYDENFQAKSILIVETDITQKKQLEQQFLRAQRMESIGTLASGIAHDLNNVFSPILMAAHLLQNQALNSQSQQVLAIVETNAKRGANLVKQVLSFARGIQGNRTVIQVKYLMAELQQIVEQTFPKTITVKAEIQQNLSPVYGDITQLEQVLINLCLNARDAMPNGGDLTIIADNICIDETFTKIHLDAQVGSYIVIKVIDTGTGISSSILDRIFEPFFTTKEFGKGTGLGLSTVIGIIKGHSGFITVSSSLGKGTEFHVYLPAVSTEIKESLPEIENPIGNGEWILLVDDEVSIQQITKTTLENHNYTVITASDGVKAIELYSHNQDQIRTAIIDMMMPNIDGITTIQKLRNINPNLTIIAMSGLITSEHLSMQQKLNHITFLPKPFTAQELLKTLHTVKNLSQ